jgi:Escherichia/Staphylococcus phage prohead protease
MLSKSYSARIKAADDGEAAERGEFEAIVSAFGNVDSYGERVVKGAFADTLKDWEASGDPIPVLWSHNSFDPRAHIGAVLDAEERDAGLWVKAQLDLDADPAESSARAVWRLLKGRRVTQFSFAYDVLDAAPVTEDEEQIVELRKLRLYEVGPTLIGVNQETELLGVKALHAMHAQLKAGRVLSSKNLARLREAHAAIGDVIAAAEPDDDDGKARVGPAAGAETPPGKASGPNRSPASDRLLIDLAELELADF